MKGESHNPEEEIAANGETYISVEVRIMRTMIDRLGISQQEFVDKYAKDMSDLIKGDKKIREKVLADDETVDEEIIAILTQERNSSR